MQQEERAENWPGLSQEDAEPPTRSKDRAGRAGGGTLLGAERSRAPVGAVTVPEPRRSHARPVPAWCDNTAQRPPARPR